MCGLRRRPIWDPNLSSPFPKISEHLFRKILGDLAGRIRRSILVLILDVTSAAISGCIFGFNFWRSECIQVPSCQLAPHEQCSTSPGRRVAWTTPAECHVRKSVGVGEGKGCVSASMWCTCCAHTPGCVVIGSYGSSRSKYARPGGMSYPIRSGVRSSHCSQTPGEWRLSRPELSGLQPRFVQTIPSYPRSQRLPVVVACLLGRHRHRARVVRRSPRRPRRILGRRHRRRCRWLTAWPSCGATTTA